MLTISNEEAAHAYTDIFLRGVSVVASTDTPSEPALPKETGKSEG
jgi:hypothetical protein